MKLPAYRLVFVYRRHISSIEPQPHTYITTFMIFIERILKVLFCKTSWKKCNVENDQYFLFLNPLTLAYKMD